jgi:hypothetical protein
MKTQRIDIANGSKRAVFLNDGEGWRPDWFYEADRPMLRFKDHEWLSLGHVRPLHAAAATAEEGGRYLFSGRAAYGATPVNWTVSVSPDLEGGGFLVESCFTSDAAIELLEAYTSFETPYEYDGSETATTVIGMNPVVRWKGGARLSPPVWQHPAWMYTHRQSARCTGPSNAPYVCQSLTGAKDVADRHVTVVGDWNICRVRDIFMTPTPKAPGTQRHGFKFIVGALNWSSASAKDPNVLFAGGQPHAQRVAVDYATALPGGTFDTLLLGAWRRAAAFSRPAEGRIEAFERTVERGVTWQTATRWLHEVFTSGKATEGFFRPGVGLCTYAPGTRPKAPEDYGWGFWTQWSGPLRYRALLTGDPKLAAACDRHDAEFAKAAGTMRFFNGIVGSAALLPTVWWIHGGGRGSLLQRALQPVLENTLESSRRENGGPRAMDYGSQAGIAEALLLAGEVYGRADMTQQAHVLLAEMNTQLDADFWAFNCGPTGNLDHGGQIRALGQGHAILVNLVAARQTGDRRFREAAHRFARYLLAVNYACHNGSADPDFDWRGWCNGSNAGRDQIGEFPPWETQEGLLGIAALMADDELEDSFHDVLWCFARTGLAQFPAARRLKRIHDESMRVRYVPREQVASERDFYDVLPYLVYENPHDQTMLAPYQGPDCLLGELVHGGGLARADDPRLGVLVPRAATMDPRETTERRVLLWNPTDQPLRATVSACWADGCVTQANVNAEPRTAQSLAIQRDGTMAARGN